MSARPDPNSERKPGDPFVYKPRLKLDPEDPTLEQKLHQCGLHNMTQHAAAAVLGVSADTLQRLWKDHPEFKEAFLQGKHMREAKLRIVGDRHMLTDPSTWRFLAKNELGMSDDPSKARLDETATKALKSQMTPAERKGRILELQAKLIGERRIVSRDVSQGGQNGHHDHSQPGAEVPTGPASGGGRARGDGAAGSAGAKATSQRGQQERLAQSQAHGEGQSKAVAALQERLAQLEASAVRKNPRKDGQPHTDRTKAPVAPPANTRQEERDHAPSRLPGRIERPR